PIPDYAGVKDMPFMTVSGNKRKEILTGMLELRSDPPGLSIYVDGLKQPQTTNAMMILPEGKHLVEVYLTATGYRNSFAVDILPGQAVLQTVSLRGELAVASYWVDPRTRAKSSG